MSDIRTIDIDLDWGSNIVPWPLSFDGTLFIYSVAYYADFNANFERMLNRLDKQLCITLPHFRPTNLDIKLNFRVANTQLARALLETLRSRLIHCRSFAIDFSFAICDTRNIAVVDPRRKSEFSEFDHQMSAFCRQVTDHGTHGRTFSLQAWQRLPVEIQDMILSYCVIDESACLGLDLRTTSGLCCGRCVKVIPNGPCNCERIRPSAWASACACQGSVARTAEWLGAIPGLREQVMRIAYGKNRFMHVGEAETSVGDIANKALRSQGYTRHVRCFTIRIEHKHVQPLISRDRILELLEVLTEHFNMPQLELTFEIVDDEFYLGWELSSFDELTDWLSLVLMPTSGNGVKRLTFQNIWSSDSGWRWLTFEEREQRKRAKQQSGWRTYIRHNDTKKRLEAVEEISYVFSFR